MVNPHSNSDWTRPFRPTNIWRSGQWTLWTMTACALVLPVFIANRTQAETEALPALPAPPSETAVAPSAASISPADAPKVDDSKTDDSKVDASAPNAPIVAAPLVAPAPKSVALTAIVAGQIRKGNVVLTPNMTVGKALAALKITLSPLDRVVPEAQTPFKVGQTIRVTRVTAQLQIRRQSIAAQVRYQPTTALKAGAKSTIQYPRAGYHEITERVWCKDGVVTSRQFVSKKLAQAPQHQIIALGVKPSLMPGAIAPHKRYALSYRGGSPRDRALNNGNLTQGVAPSNLLRVVRTLKVTTTGYNGAEMGGGGSRTATGLRCTYGAIAVDPRVIPLGSKLYVEGYGYGFACDTGGAIKGHHIDLAFDSVRAAQNHGKVRGVTVYVLSE